MEKKKFTLARPNYFQGILQLRDINEEIMAFVSNQVAKREDVFVTKTVKLENGFDLYISSQQFIRAIGKKLKESFGGQLNITSQLHTKRQGKDLYRVNALFRLSKYRRGDTITVRGDVVKIIHIGNQKIFAKDMKTGRKVTIRLEDLPNEGEEDK
ncbi:MAG: NMD3-related protein [Nanoarchaeota archaeon]